MEYDSNILKFFLTASNLKRLKRKGWISKASIDSSTAESVADHSYMLALIALVISDLKHMDTCKVLKISLLHDLAESIVGDYMPEELDKEETGG
jgi:putative hydrolase of HD superfamily